MAEVSERELKAQRARTYLYWLGAMAFIAATTATMTYSYPETFGLIEGAMIVTHDAAGDIAIVISVLYLFNHLSRTWKMKKQVISRWSGILVVALWAVAGLTGLYGHFVKLEDGTLVWLIHAWFAIIVTIIACAHGAWAYRPRKKAS